MPPIRSTPGVVLTPPAQSEAQGTQDNTATPREQPTTQQSTTQRADHFGGPQETGRPGASFTNQLLGLDRDADGQISRQEFAAGSETLKQLAADGKENDLTEGSLLQMMLAGAVSAAAADTDDVPAARYQVLDGQLVIHTGTEEDQRSITFEHENVDPALQDQVLMEAATAKVVHGTDPGDFYCEHMFFSAQMEASRPESPVATNAQGEKLVGFLHVPSDRQIYQSEPSGYTQAERHESTRQVVGAALRGYADAARASLDEGEPVKMLLSGYDTFMWVKNNPTGEFVSHQENLDASMQAAYGDQLLTRTGELLPPSAETPENINTYRYQIIDEATGTPRDVLLSTAHFAVDDTAISPESGTSIQQAMAALSPHAVLSMGVAGRGTYKAEHRADSGDLQREGDTARHIEHTSDRVQLRDNFSLARAIEYGAAQTNP